MSSTSVVRNADDKPRMAGGMANTNILRRSNGLTAIVCARWLGAVALMVVSGCQEERIDNDGGVSGGSANSAGDSSSSGGAKSTAGSASSAGDSSSSGGAKSTAGSAASSGGSSGTGGAKSTGGSGGSSPADVGSFEGACQETGDDAGVESSEFATLLVNDTSATGTVGDNNLSLEEAIGLANGSLAFDKLSGGERAQVHGTPGPQGADFIKVELPRETVLSGQAPLSVIRGNTGDTIDGNGATLSAAGIGNGLLISSSCFMVKDLTIKGGSETQIAIDPAGESLHDIVVKSVHLDPGAKSLIMVGSSKSYGSLNGLTITDSVFDGGDVDILVALNGIVGTGDSVFDGDTMGQSLLTVGIGAGYGNKNKVENNSLENVLFARNKVINGFEGMYLSGGLVAGRGEVNNSITRHVQLIDNEFTNVADAAMNAIGLEGIGSGSNNGVEDLMISGNKVESVDWGIGIWGGEEFGEGEQRNNYVRGVDIHDNTVVGTGPGIAGASFCIDLEGAWTTIRPGTESGASISDVRIHDNHISGTCTAGIKVTGGQTLIAEDAFTTDNSVYDISIEENDVRGADTGLEIMGGYTWAPAGAHVTGNSVRSVHVAKNTFVGNGSGTGINLVGGVSESDSEVTGNSIEAITFEDNVVEGYDTACVSEVDMGSATGNSNTATCP